MTTPERFRRRQRIEGAILIVLALFTVSYGVWDSGEARGRDKCMVRSFQQSSDVLDARSELGELTTELSLEVDALQSKQIALQKRVIQEVAVARQRSSEDIDRVFANYDEAVNKISGEAARLRALRKDVLATRKGMALPAYPDGKCS